MLSGVKFISREKIDERKKADRRVEKHKSKRKVTACSSSDDGYYKGKKKKSGRRKKFNTSDDYSTSSADSEKRKDSLNDGKKRLTRKMRKRNSSSDSWNEDDKRVKMKARSDSIAFTREYSSSTSDDNSSGSVEGYLKRSKRRERKCNKETGQICKLGEDMSDGIGETSLKNDEEIVRKEMGLEWMLKPQEEVPRCSAVPINCQQEEAPEEINKENPKELNPYFKDNGTGYPEDNDSSRSDRSELPPSSVVGDGGASWRLKALKRAQEQAAREGQRLEEVAKERWGSLGQLAVSVASSKVAPSRSHLHAIRNRQRGLTKDNQEVSNKQNKMDPGKSSARDYLKDVSSRHPEMREPKIQDSLSWKKQKSHNVSSKDAGLISTAVSSLNKFSDDGSFASQFLKQQSKNSGCDTVKTKMESTLALSKSEMTKEICISAKDAVSANQLAAKAFQLQMKGKHEEAEKLLQEAQTMETNSGQGNPIKPQKEGTVTRKMFPNASRRNKEEDADLHLAKKIMGNKQYSMAGRADDEYDYEGSPKRKSKSRRGSNDDKLSGKRTRPEHILTKEERCSFCFENPNRPKHLTVSIANCTYLMLPQWQPIVTGHCCILPIQHESATRTVEKNVWEEIRNFKKCLIMMFAKQGKDVVFLETVVGLAKQRRHCLIECIPLPQDIAKEAPLYFKKAIDEAEEEWSQHNAKKLIDTSEKGLRGSIPEHFPYFHVEFGLNRGFVHVIDDEKNFKSSFGLNVIRGMLRLAEEDMHRRRKHESPELQNQAVANFIRDWDPFDWTKQL